MPDAEVEYADVELGSRVLELLQPSHADRRAAGRSDGRGGREECTSACAVDDARGRARAADGGRMRGRCRRR